MVTASYATPQFSILIILKEHAKTKQTNSQLRKIAQQTPSMQSPTTQPTATKPTITQKVVKKTSTNVKKIV